MVRRTASPQHDFCSGKTGRKRNSSLYGATPNDLAMMRALRRNRLFICIGGTPCECDALLKTNGVAGRAQDLSALSYIPLHRLRGGLLGTRHLSRAKDNSCPNAYF